MTGSSAWLMHASIESATDEAEAIQTQTSRAEILAGVRKWGYQLQGFDASRARSLPHDLLVVDEAFDLTLGDERRAQALKALQRKADGSRRLVLAYLSIGEAEDYRRYWNRTWVQSSPDAIASSARSVPAPSPIRTAALGRGTPTALVQPLRIPSSAAPKWLGDENPEWRGNYRVRFWQSEWQAQMWGSPEAAIERLIKAGFDGVYLDRADVYAHWRQERPSAREDMIDLLVRLSAHAKAKAPGFLVVMQNAEELLSSRKIRGALDAAAKEDLLFGVEVTGQENSATDIASSLKNLRKARRDGLLVMVVEYLDDPARMADVRNRLDSEGFVTTFGRRALDSLSDAD